MRTRWSRRIVALAATGAAVAGMAVAGASLEASAAGAAPAVYDGSTWSLAAPSCWAIKQIEPTATDGVYWLETPQLGVPRQYYCDMTTDGGGWVLIGRGREGWTWSSNGQRSMSAVRDTPTGTAAFAPATLPDDVVDGLLGGTRVDALPDGVRVKRAMDIGGTKYQEMRINLSNRSDWSWAIGGGELFSKITVTLKAYAAGNTQSWGVDQNFLRMTTNESASHDYKMGFAYGSKIAGQNNATSYLWTYTTEKSALPFTQVFIRPKLTSVSYPAIPDTGLPAHTVTPLEGTTTVPMPWGVTGIVGGGTGEFNLEVEAMAYIGRTMYVGGKFQYVQHGATGEKIEQSYLAAFDVDTGEWVPSFRPTLDGTVWDLQALPNGNLLVGGEFTQVDGAANTTALAELDPATGALIDGWKSYVTYKTAAAQVKAIDVEGGWAYIAGRFTTIYNGATPITVSRVARVKVTDGTPDGSWKPQLDGTVVDLDVSSRGDRVYLVGYFDHIDGVSSPDEGAVSTAPGAAFITGLAPWIPSIGSGTATYQQTIREYGNDVWQGGSEHDLQVYDRDTYTLQHSVITKNGGDFQALTEIDGVVYAGCHCANYVYSEDNNYSTPIPYASDVHDSRFIIAFDAATGAVIPGFWIGGLEAREGDGAWELQPDPNGCLWFGGDFTTGSNGQWLGGFGKVCPRDTTAPTAPTGLKAGTVADGIRLTWTGSTDNSGDPVTYEVLRNDRVIGTNTATTYTDTTATLPARYWVRAVDATGNASPTTPVLTVSQADVAAPTVAITSPVNGAQVFGLTTVAVSATDDVGVASVTLKVDGTAVGTLTAAPYVFTWNASTAGTHSLVASAADAAGNVGTSPTVTVSVPADTTPPTAPAGLQATAVAATSVELAWQAATDDRGVTGYQVLRDGTVVATVTALSATDSGLTPGASYTYAVRAFDAAGNVGPTSSPITVTTAGALFQETFTAPDGSPWPAAWTTTAANGTVTVRSGTGELAVQDITYANARAQLTGVDATTDTDLTLSYQWNAATPTAYLSFYLRGSGGWKGSYRPLTGYGVQIQSNSATVLIQKTVNATVTTLQTATGAQQVSTAKHWLRLHVQGSTIQFKIWTDGQAEPAAWTGSVTDTSITTAGQLYISLNRAGSNVGAKSVALDDVTLAPVN